MSDDDRIDSGQPAPISHTAPTPDRARPATRSRWLMLAAGAAILAGAAFTWQSSTGQPALPSVSAALAAVNAAPAGMPEAQTAPADPAAAVQANARQLDSLVPVLARGEDLLAAASAMPSSPDARLLRIYGLIATSQARQALDESQQLAQELPSFGLAQLVYADLLTTLSSPTEGFGAVSQPLRAEASERLRELVAEARARVSAAGHRPPTGTVPAQFVKIDPSVRHAVAIDVSRSRLYVFENTPTGLVLKADYYSSVGKLGLAKQVEGDLRTPIGVYFGTGRISESKLRDPSVEDRYGAAAIALNYPNQYDQLKGRTGSGIWLHGVATALFSRAPLATDGCVALSNPDMLALTGIVERQETPILIAEKLEWVTPASAQERYASFMQTFDAWRSARSSADVDRLQPFYALDAEGARTERKRAPRIRSAGTGPIDIDGVSVVWWKDDREVVVVTYTENNGRQSRSRQKRQYWLQNAGQWKVMFEGNLA